MIDLKPEDYYGEMIVWDAIKDNLPDEYIVYNGREVDGQQYDFCVLMPNKAILIIEVKGWLPNTVNVISANEIQLNEPLGIQRSPKIQARRYRFALIRKIKERLKANPYVFDMVCFPRITREEYYDLHLDIVVEEKYTIFKDDLSSDTFQRKILEAMGSANLSFEALDSDLLFRLRQMNEIDVLMADSNISKMYSELRVITAESLDMETAVTMVNQYVSGIKQILFVSSPSLYEQIIECLKNKLVELHVSPKGMNLVYGGTCDLSGYLQKTEMKLFNIEIYLISQNCDIDETIVIDGHFNDTQAEVLQKLSEITTFNFEQYCVEHADDDKNVVVKAGAGTGKTYSMISRVAFLCNKHKDHIDDIADELAMVTFTNEAADNMKNRLKRLFMNYAVLTGDDRYHRFIKDVDRARIMTIHKFAIEILRQLSMYTGLGSQFSISVDQYIRDQIYDKYLDKFIECKIGENSNFLNTLPVYLYEIKKKLSDLSTKILTKSIDVEELNVCDFGRASGYLPWFNDVIKNVMLPSESDYLEYLHSMNEINLSETIILLNRVLKNHMDEIRLNEFKIKYLFIDEFQDTDDVQIDLFIRLQSLIGENCKVFVVGDIKQSIYRFRGATIEAFDRLNDFKYDWNPTFYLKRNYRTEYRLLDKFDPIFKNLDSHQFLKYSENDRLLGTRHFDTPDDNVLTCISVHGKDTDAFYDRLFMTIADQKNKIEKQSAHGLLTKEERTIALLVRNNYHIDSVISEGKKRNIEIEQCIGGTLYKEDAVLDLYKLVTAIQNPINPTYLLNLIDSDYINIEFDHSCMKSMTQEEKTKLLTDYLNQYFVSYCGFSWEELIIKTYNQPVLHILKKLYDQLKPWKNYSDNKYAQKQYMLDYETIIEKIIQSDHSEKLSLSSVSLFLSINILTSQKEERRTLFDHDDDNQVRVICSTIHHSKGLEYGTVILPFMNEDISNENKEKLNIYLSKDKFAYFVRFDNGEIEHNSNYDATVEIKEQISEETRILYVALTRTIRNCIWFKDLDSNANVSWTDEMERNVDYVS